MTNRIEESHWRQKEITNKLTIIYGRGARKPLEPAATALFTWIFSNFFTARYINGNRFTSASTAAEMQINCYFICIMKTSTDIPFSIVRMLYSSFCFSMYSISICTTITATGTIIPISTMAGLRWIEIQFLSATFIATVHQGLLWFRF